MGEVGSFFFLLVSGKEGSVGNRKALAEPYILKSFLECTSISFVKAYVAIGSLEIKWET